MSISNTVTKVEEFEFDNVSETTVDNELTKPSSTEGRPLRAKSLMLAARA